MSLPNLSSFRGIYWNEDTTGTPGRTTRPNQQPITSVEHAAFSDINIIETGGKGHNELSVQILLAAGSYPTFLTEIGEIGTLIHNGVTRSTAALLTELSGGTYIFTEDVYSCHATWIW